MTESTVRGFEEHTARNMADALTYLGRVASDAGYHSVVADIHALRDRLASIARAEEEAKLGQPASA